MTDETKPAQVSFDLPEHHGRKPAGMRTKLNGAGNRIAESHTIGDRVVLVVEAHVKDAGHTRTEKDGLLYQEKLAVDDLWEVDGGQVQDLLAGLRQSYRQAEDERHGRAPLFDTPKVGRLIWADENGYPLDADALALIRGEQEEGESDEARDARLQAEEDAAAANEAIAPRHLRALPDDAVGYDGLSAADIKAAVKVCDDFDVLARVINYEREGKNRASIIAAAETRGDLLVGQ